MRAQLVSLLELYLGVRHTSDLHSLTSQLQLAQGFACMAWHGGSCQPLMQSFLGALGCALACGGRAS